MRRPTTVRESDALFGAITALVGAFVLYQSMQMTFSSEGVPGPGFFPVLLAISLILLGGILIVTRLMQDPDRADAFQLPSRRAATRSLSLWSAVLVAAFLIAPLGFLLSMVLLVAFICFVIEGRRGLGSILTTILVPVLVWLLFAGLLQVRLPTGPFGF